MLIIIIIIPCHSKNRLPLVNSDCHYRVTERTLDPLPRFSAKECLGNTIEEGTSLTRGPSPLLDIYEMKVIYEMKDDCNNVDYRYCIVQFTISGHNLHCVSFT